MKKILSVLLAVVMVFSLAACGNKNVSEPEVKEPVQQNEQSDVENTPVAEEHTMVGYLEQDDNAEGMTEVLSMKNVRFFVDSDVYDRSVDFMSYMSAAFGYAFSAMADGAGFEETDSEEPVNEDINDINQELTADDFLAILQSPLRLESSDVFMMVDTEKGCMSCLANLNSEHITEEGVEAIGDVNSLDLSKITKDELNEMLNSSMEDANSVATSNTEQTYSIGEVYNFGNKIIFEMSTIMNLADYDVTSSLNMNDGEEDTAVENRYVDLNGYGVLIKDEENAYIGFFITSSDDIENMLLSAKSVEIDYSVEGLSEEDDLFGNFLEDIDSSVDDELDFSEVEVIN